MVSVLYSTERPVFCPVARVDSNRPEVCHNSSTLTSAKTPRKRSEVRRDPRFSGRMYHNHYNAQFTSVVAVRHDTISVDPSV